MTVWHVNLADTYEGSHTRDGMSPPQAWGGGAGLIRAIASASAGDTILAANAADPLNNQPLMNLLRMDLADTTGFDVGDLLTNQDGAGTGRIACVTPGAYVLFELISGAFTGGDSVSADGGVTVVPAGNVSPPGVWIDEDFASDGPVTLAGVAADWVTRERACFDCDSTCNGLTIGAVADWTVRGVEFDAPAAYGIYKDGSSTQTGWCFEDVGVVNPAFAAAHLEYLPRATLRRFDATGATAYGVFTAPAGGRFEHCVFADNAVAGIGAVGDDSVIEGCLVVGNGVGIDRLGSGCSVVGCVIDGSVGHGVVGDFAANSVRLLRNRITHNGGCGIDATGADPAGWVIDRNVFFANASGPVAGAAVGDANHGAVGSGLSVEDVAGDGYVDRAAGEYALAADAVGRRMAVELNAANTAFATAGMGADDLARPLDHQVSFHTHEVTFP